MMRLYVKWFIFIHCGLVSLSAHSHLKFPLQKSIRKIVPISKLNMTGLLEMNTVLKPSETDTVWNWLDRREFQARIKKRKKKTNSKFSYMYTCNSNHIHIQSYMHTHYVTTTVLPWFLCVYSVCILYNRI